MRFRVPPEEKAMRSETRRGSAPPAARACEKHLKPARKTRIHTLPPNAFYPVLLALTRVFGGAGFCSDDTGPSHAVGGSTAEQRVEPGPRCPEFGCGRVGVRAPCRWREADYDDRDVLQQRTRRCGETVPFDVYWGPRPEPTGQVQQGSTAGCGIPCLEDLRRCIVWTNAVSPRARVFDLAAEEPEGRPVRLRGFVSL